MSSGGQKLRVDAFDLSSSVFYPAYQVGFGGEGSAQLGVITDARDVDGQGFGVARW